MKSDQQSNSIAWCQPITSIHVFVVCVHVCVCVCVCVHVHFSFCIPDIRWTNPRRLQNKNSYTNTQTDTAIVYEILC